MATKTTKETKKLIDEFLSKSEDETFERTSEGQDNIGTAVAGFGTKNGGLLLVGQMDLKSGGKIIGLSETDFQTQFTQAIANVHPTPLTQQQTYETNSAKVYVIKVQDAGTSRPCSYKGVYYERKGDSTLKLKPEEVKRYHLLYGSANAEDMPSHATKSEIDEMELQLYADILKRTKENIRNSITSEKGHLTVRGTIVLGKNPSEFIEGAFVEIQRYDNVIGSAPRPMGAPIIISKPARQMIEETAKVIEQNLPVSRTYEGAKMIQAPAVPISVIRETVVNAVAHRNYSSHEHILVRIYADGFDIRNPAAITPRMWEEILETHTTYHPNEGIYTFLNPTLLYEGKGEGIWKIREELERLGKTSPEFRVIGESPSLFYTAISLSSAKARDVKILKLQEVLGRNKEMTTSEAMKLLNVSRVTAIKLLNTLVKQGILEHYGNRRTSKYTSRITKEPNS